MDTASDEHRCRSSPAGHRPAMNCGPAARSRCRPGHGPPSNRRNRPGPWHVGRKGPDSTQLQAPGPSVSPPKRARSSPRPTPRCTTARPLPARGG